jgi:CCR4-NOT transcriptional complex subunit CAF120
MGFGSNPNLASMGLGMGGIIPMMGGGMNPMMGGGMNPMMMGGMNPMMMGGVNPMMMGGAMNPVQSMPSLGQMYGANQAGYNPLLSSMQQPFMSHPNMGGPMYRPM